MARLMALPFLALAAVSAAVVAPAPTPRPTVEARVATKHACVSQAETRELIKAQHLREPFAVLKSAAQHFKSEALSAKLCRIDDELIYEIALLHRDGKFFRAHIDATTGRIVEYRRAPVAPPKN